MAKKKQRKGDQKPKSKAFSSGDSVITQALERFCLSNDEGKLKIMTQIEKKGNGVFPIAFVFNGMDNGLLPIGF